MFTEGRPTGVTVVASLAAIAGILPFVFGIIGLIGATATLLSPGPTPALPAAVSSVLFFAIGVACFAVAAGLFSMRPWAWLAAIAVGVLAIANSVLNALSANVGWAHAIVVSILPIILVVYLMRPDVRRVFGR